jgi:hypothetical protein
MFVTQHELLPLSLGTAQARLVNLVDQGGLATASHEAYMGQAEHLIRVGPLGPVHGASRLVKVSFLDPVYRDDAMIIGLRWEAAGVTGGLFPVLDANLTVTRQDETTTRLSLEGSYRPPFGGLGAGLDQAILSKVAGSTARALLRDVAVVLAEPSPAAPEPGTATGLAGPLAIGPLTE